MRAGSDAALLWGSEAERLARAPFAVLPMGSFEYHGPGGAFGTDTILATGLADRLAARTECVVFPPVTYTFVPELTLRHGPGVSVGAATLVAYLTDVVAGLLAIGPRRLLVLNGHSENQYSLRLAAETATQGRPGSSVLLCDWWKLAPRGLFTESDGHGHGGPLEMSTTAALDERAVDVAGHRGEDIAYRAPWWRGAAQVVGAGQAPAGFAGYHGRVSEVDVGKGTELVEGVVAELVRLVGDWLAVAEG